MRTNIRGEEFCFCYRGDSLLVVDGNNVTVKIRKIWGLKFWTSLTLGVSTFKRERWDLRRLWCLKLWMMREEIKLNKCEIWKLIHLDLWSEHVVANFLKFCFLFLNLIWLKLARHNIIFREVLRSQYFYNIFTTNHKL